MRFSPRRMLRTGLVAAVLALGAAGAAGAETVTVFAAASLKTALDAVADRFEAETGHRVRLSYAGSSVLARQIIQGAPADVFIAAHPAWMDAATEAGAIETESRFDLLSNRLVLIAPGPAPDAPRLIDPAFDLAGALAGGRLAMALVDAVPAGLYGKAALEALGLWSGVHPQVVETDNVRTALALVAAGEAPLGVVYATDAAASDRVHVVGTFPESSHPPVIYPVAAVAGRTGAAPRAILETLRAPMARDIFASQGFIVLGE